MQRKVVLVTGGSSGIGRAIANFLKNKGMIVYGTTRDTSKYPNFNDFDLLQLDVREQSSIQRAVSKLVELEGKIDVLVNNAGVGITGPVEETPISAINQAFDTNFDGPLRVLKEVLPIMRKQQSGLVINITSIAGYMGLPYRGIYSSTKGAMEIVTEAIRMETKSFGIKCCTLAPGDYATNIAQGRYQVPLQEQSPYFQSYQHSINLMNDHVDSGGNPDEVAKMVWKIMNTKSPKVHYRVGAFMQKFSIILKKILPSKVYEKLLLQHYKL